MGDYPHLCKGKIPIAHSENLRQFDLMSKEPRDPFVKGLKALVDAKVIKMKPISISAGMGESGVRDLIRYNSSPRIANAIRIAESIGMDVEAIIEFGETGNFADNNNTGHVTIAGYVGAGAHVTLTDDFAKGDGLYHVERPKGLPTNGIVGVEVKGDSMAPSYHEGDVLFYSREFITVPSEAIGRICVCEDATGQVWVKHVKVGTRPGLFHLLSINPIGDNMLDAVLRWASPVRLHLPQEFVTRVNTPILKG